MQFLPGLIYCGMPSAVGLLAFPALLVAGLEKTVEFLLHQFPVVRTERGCSLCRSAHRGIRSEPPLLSTCTLSCRAKISGGKPTQLKKFCWKRNGESWCSWGSPLVLTLFRSAIPANELVGVTEKLVELLSHLVSR